MPATKACVAMHRKENPKDTGKETKFKRKEGRGEENCNEHFLAEVAQLLITMHPISRDYPRQKTDFLLIT